MKIITAFHGTNGRFSKFEQSKARIVNDYYGGGVAYFTDTLEVAKSYASFMFRKFGGDKFVYQVEIRFDKIFDVDEVYTGDIIKRFVGSQPEQFARGAGLLSLGVDRYAILSMLKTGKIELSGDQVFRGLSNGMQNTARAREALKSAGFDGLRHNGGVAMGGAKHNVYLAYEASSINIKERMIVSATPVERTANKEVYTYIN